MVGVAGGTREQVNMATACIDGSQVYGPSATRAQNLRTFSGGYSLTYFKVIMLALKNCTQGLS